MTITFEGPVGSGKTTAMLIVAHTLRRCGFTVSGEPLHMESNQLMASFDGFEPQETVLNRGGVPSPWVVNNGG
jgi:Holliday junction resolvasome RuvABC ATP-dependent DNA helicase subunit